MTYSVKHAIALSFLAVAPALVAQVEPAPRAPQGIYTVVNIEQNLNQQQQMNPSITPAELDAYFNSLYQSLLADSAVAGLTLQVHWDTLNPNSGRRQRLLLEYRRRRLRRGCGMERQ